MEKRHITDPDEDLRRAFSLMEGVGWFKQATKLNGDLSIAMRLYEAHGTLDESEPMARIKMFTIYGAGGSHRYGVTHYGEIFYMAWSETMEKQHFRELAECMGFSIRE